MTGQIQSGSSTPPQTREQILEETATLLLAACEDMIESLTADHCSGKQTTMSIETVKLAVEKARKVLT